MQIHHEQITKNKNNPKPCSFSFCTNFIKLSNDRISKFIFNNPTTTKIKRVISHKSEPPKCPAIGLFPPLSENKNYIPISGKQLCWEIKQLINNTELAIIRLEQLNTQNNLFKEINEGIENIEEEENVLVKQFVLQVKELFELAKKIEKVVEIFKFVKKKYFLFRKI